MPRPPAITVRGLAAGVHRGLKHRAADRGVSMEEEVRAILADAVDGSPLTLTPAAAAPRHAPEPAPVPASAGAPQILLVIGGGIAAYKSLDLIRRLRERGHAVRVVMTAAATEFVTPLAAGALSGGRVFTALFDRQAEIDVGHIRLAREAALVVVAPATADLMARMVAGRADDLATAVLLATRAPVLLAPAMNPAMWAHPATRRNFAQLTRDGIQFVGPEAGDMAESGEAGMGRMAEPLAIAAAVGRLLAPQGPLAGRHVIVTSGPTHEPIDPVRYLANRSSGRQGHAIAAAAAAAGARVTLVSGPVALADPAGVKVIRVLTAREMLAAVEAALPADIAIMAAAVADWRSAEARASKIKKGRGGPPPLALVENPDILATVAGMARRRPRLVIGFAAETDDLTRNAAAKLKSKGADWIVANDVSAAGGVMGGEQNTVEILTAAGGVEAWPRLSKDEVARRLVARAAAELSGGADGTGVGGSAAPGERRRSAAPRRPNRRLGRA